MKRFPLILPTAALVLVVMLVSRSAEEKTHKLTSVSIRKMADSLHAVIAADRDAYARLSEQRLPADARRSPAGTNRLSDHGLPIHAQMLRTAQQETQKRGAEFSYTLRSLWPINVNQGPQTEVEQTGLERVARNPEENFYAEELLGGRSYFTAVYADRAMLSCVQCHNDDQRSPRHDFKPGDVMGAIVVRVPLEF